MFTTQRTSMLRCLLTWLTATTIAAAMVAWAAPDLSAAHEALTNARPAPPFDTWLTWLCAAATALCAAWGWLVTSVVVLEALSGRVRPSRWPGVPGWARRVVLAACGVAVLGAATPSVAADLPVDDDGRHRAHGRADLLDGLPLPDRAEGRSVSEAVARAIGRSPAAHHSEVAARPGEVAAGRVPTRQAPSAAGDHLVLPGDSLWSVAAAALAAAHGHSGEPTATEVASYWPRIYALNRALLGPDPDLLLPGQVLRLPELGDPTTREDDR